MDKAPDFELLDSQNQKVRLSSLWKDSPLLIVFYPGDFTPVCTAQLCDYRDNYDELRGLGVKLVGISQDSPDKHAKFAQAYGFPFTLLSDTANEVPKAYACVSKWSFGTASRAVCLVNTDGQIVWRHVEPFVITRRRAAQLKEIVGQLTQSGTL